MTRILIVDDHPMVRRATKELIKEHFEDIEVLESETAEKSIEMSKNDNPDLIIMDIYFKDQEMDGITAVNEILKVSPDAKIIIISNEDNVNYIRRLQEGPAKLEENFGYILKNEPEENIIEAISSVLGGDYYYSKSIFKRLITAEDISKSDLPSMVQTPSDGELDVLKRVAKGMTNERIAGELSISRRTVDARLCSIYSKLLVGEVKDGVIPRVEAVLRAKKYGIITDNDITLIED
ncbi:MAG: response regulator transcription factor [Cyanobacteriota bacterium]